MPVGKSPGPIRRGSLNRLGRQIAACSGPQILHPALVTALVTAGPPLQAPPCCSESEACGGRLAHSPPAQLELQSSHRFPFPRSRFIQPAASDRAAAVRPARRLRPTPPPQSAPESVALVHFHRRAGGLARVRDAGPRVQIRRCDGPDRTVPGQQRELPRVFPQALFYSILRRRVRGSEPPIWGGTPWPPVKSHPMMAGETRYLKPRKNCVPVRGVRTRRARR